MGVWANGPDATTVDVPGIAAAMRPALEMWMTAHVRIWDPARAAAGTRDPYTDVVSGGTSRVLVLDSGPSGALVQPLRSPSRIDAGSQATNLLGVRFQIKRGIAVESGQVLRGGLVLEVVDGGNDEELVRWQYSLGDAVSSSLAWDRIYEGTVISGGR